MTARGSSEHDCIRLPLLARIRTAALRPESEVPPQSIDSLVEELQGRPWDEVLPKELETRMVAALRPEMLHDEELVNAPQPEFFCGTYRIY